MSAATAESGRGQGRGKHVGGSPGGEAACSACGETNRAGARYCQGCGRSLTGGGWLDAQTLTILGAAAIALLAIGALFSSVIDTGTTSGDLGPTTTARTAPENTGQPPDLSTMSPREAADRLFNRVMMADEQGNADEVAQFAPMAAAAYDRLDDLDLDAIYHVGLIHAAAGDREQAEEAIERLRAVVPEHLLASSLEHRLAVEAGDQARANRAIERFLASYDEEIKVDRPEYRDHMTSIDQFREQIGDAESGG